MDPDVRKGIRRRQEWIRRNPGGAGDYIRLSKIERDKVDKLFLANRKLKANEVSSLVERLTEKRLAQRRTGGIKNRALANIRAQLGIKPKYGDKTVVANVKKMTKVEAEMAAASTADELARLAYNQYEGNPFYYH